MGLTRGTYEHRAFQVQVQPEKISPIEIVDRCEKCNARAYVATLIAHPSVTVDGHIIDGEITETILYWCAHHYREHRDVLEAQAVAIRNEEERINLKPSVSANV